MLAPSIERTLPEPVPHEARPENRKGEYFRRVEYLDGRRTEQKLGEVLGVPTPFRHYEILTEYAITRARIKRDDVMIIADKNPLLIGSEIACRRAGTQVIGTENQGIANFLSALAIGSGPLQTSLVIANRSEIPRALTTIRQQLLSSKNGKEITIERILLIEEGVELKGNETLLAEHIPASEALKLLLDENHASLMLPLGSPDRHKEALTTPFAEATFSGIAEDLILAQRTWLKSANKHSDINQIALAGDASIADSLSLVEPIPLQEKIPLANALSMTFEPQAEPIHQNIAVSHQENISIDLEHTVKNTATVANTDKTLLSIAGDTLVQSESLSAERESSGIQIFNSLTNSITETLPLGVSQSLTLENYSLPSYELTYELTMIKEDVLNSVPEMPINVSTDVAITIPSSLETISEEVRHNDTIVAAQVYSQEDRIDYSSASIKAPSSSFAEDFATPKEVSEDVGTQRAFEHDLQDLLIQRLSGDTVKIDTVKNEPAWNNTMGIEVVASLEPSLTKQVPLLTTASHPTEGQGSSVTPAKVDSSEIRKEAPFSDFDLSLMTFPSLRELMNRNLVNRNLINTEDHTEKITADRLDTNTILAA